VEPQSAVSPRRTSLEIRMLRWNLENAAQKLHALFELPASRTNLPRAARALRGASELQNSRGAFLRAVRASNIAYGFRTEDLKQKYRVGHFARLGIDQLQLDSLQSKTA